MNLKSHANDSVITVKTVNDRDKQCARGTEDPDVIIWDSCSKDKPACTRHVPTPPFTFNHYSSHLHVHYHLSIRTKSAEIVH